MNQGIVEKDEPVDRKTACVLKSQSLITGLTDQPPRRFTKRVLKEEENSWLPAQLHPRSSSPPQVHWNKTLCSAGRAPDWHLTGKVAWQQQGDSRSSFQESSSRSGACTRLPSSSSSDEEPWIHILSRHLAASDNPQNSVTQIQRWDFL